MTGTSNRMLNPPPSLSFPGVPRPRDDEESRICVPLRARFLASPWSGGSRTSLGMTRLTSEQGSALLEFALMLTILLTLMFGVMDFSRALYAYHFLSNAAREATRYASVRGSSFPTACSDPPPVQYVCHAVDPGGADITAYVYSIVAPGIYVKGNTANSSCASPSLSQLNVCTKWPGATPTGSTGPCATNNAPGCVVQVEVLYNYEFTLPFVSKDVSSITMTSTSETVIQQ